MKGGHKSTHAHSKTVGHRSGGEGYPALNRGISSHASKVGRPDIAYSTGKGRQGAGNNTVKNHA